MFKRIIATLLTVIIFIGILPLEVFATSSDGTTTSADVFAFLTEYGSKLNGKAGEGKGIPALTAAGEGWYFTFIVENPQNTENPIYYNTLDSDNKIPYGHFGDSTLAITNGENIYRIIAESPNKDEIDKDSYVEKPRIYFIDDNTVHHIDIFGVLLFIERVHTMYHTKAAWSALGLNTNGLNIDFKFDDSTQAADYWDDGDTRYFSKQLCADPMCPLLQCVSLADGRNDGKTALPIASLYSDVCVKDSSDGEYSIIQEAFLDECTAMVLPDNEEHHYDINNPWIILNLFDTNAFSAVDTVHRESASFFDTYIKALNYDASLPENASSKMHELTAETTHIYNTLKDLPSNEYKGSLDTFATRCGMKLEGVVPDTTAQHFDGCMRRILFYYLEVVCDVSALLQLDNGPPGINRESIDSYLFDKTYTLCYLFSLGTNLITHTEALDKYTYTLSRKAAGNAITFIPTLVSGGKKVLMYTAMEFKSVFPTAVRAYKAFITFKEQSIKYYGDLLLSGVGKEFMCSTEAAPYIGFGGKDFFPVVFAYSLINTLDGTSYTNIKTNITAKTGLKCSNMADLVDYAKVKKVVCDDIMRNYTAWNKSMSFLEFYATVVCGFSNTNFFTDTSMDGVNYQTIFGSKFDKKGFESKFVEALGNVWDKYKSVGDYLYPMHDGYKHAGGGYSDYWRATFFNDHAYKNKTEDGKVTAVMKAELDRLEAEYDACSSIVTSSALPNLATLAIRAEIIDFYAKYKLKADDLLNRAIKETGEKVKSTFTDERMKALCLYLKTEDAFNFAEEYLSEYFVYQALLILECQSVSFTLWLDLFVQMAGKGLSMTYKGSQQYVNYLADVHDILQTHPCDKSHFIWANRLGLEDPDALARWDSEHPGDEPSLASLYYLFLTMGLIGNISTAVDIYEEANPLTRLFTLSGSNIMFDNNYYIGRALSATYIPMQTNLYDPYAMLDFAPIEFIENFHYKYGFNRKALKIDTSPDAATDYFTTKSHGTTRVATLKDLYNCEGDIVLYVDTSFYNLSELAERQDKVFDRLSNYDTSPLRQAWNSFTELFGFLHEIDFRVALKWGEHTTYSTKIHTGGGDATLSGLDWMPTTKEVKKKDDDGNEITVKERDLSKDKFYDDYLLYHGDAAHSTILEYLDTDEYSPMRGFALVSAIYRDSGAFSTINRLSANPEPVFISSPTVWAIPGASKDARTVLYNYSILKNLKGMSTVGYETSLDMTSPIYIDIYGNISTESGAVVVPASCNASLHQNTYNEFEPICTGFLASYGKDWSIPLTTNADKAWLSNFFVENEKTGVWDIKAQSIGGTAINFAQMSYAEAGVRQSLMNWYQYDMINAKTLNQQQSLRVLHEVMRGAPTEYIDKDEEDLNVNRSISKQGLIAAAKLDSIVNSLHWDDENSITSVPNMSFIDNYQYVVVYIFKIIIVIIIIALMITVYIDAIKQCISGKTILKCLSVLLIGVGSVLLIPVSFSISYYQSNKLLLQDEASYIVMLNTEKKISGREIGITEVTEPEQNTKVYIKLEGYSFNWIKALPDVVFGDSINAIDKQYKEFLDSSMIAKADKVLCENDGIYMDVQDIFDTSMLQFNAQEKTLYQRVTIDPVASYYIPYYYFLDSLIWNVNNWNESNNCYAFSTKIMSGGYIKTINLASGYFNSPEFMDETNDLLGLRQLYDYEGDIFIRNIFAADSAEAARGSQWYTANFIKQEDLYKRLDIMDDYVCRWIEDNRAAFGRVTDETLLKCLAMDMALKYNALFGIPSASAYEIYNLSNADLLRLVISDKNTTLEGSPVSFARFVYDVGDTPAVFASVFLVIMTMFTSTVRTILTIAIMVLLILSVYINKILLRRSTNSVAGYLLTLLVVTGANVLYALILKLSLLIPQTGLAPTLCIILQIFVQLAYIALMVLVLVFALRDWKNFGFTKYSQIGTNIKNSFHTFRHKHSGNQRDRYDSKPRGVNGWTYLDKLEESFKRKQKKVGKG